MNKQEKEKFIEKILSWGSWCNEVHTGELDRYIKISKVREFIKDVDEPQQLVVKPFVAEWFEKNKKALEYRIWKYIKNWDDQKQDDFKVWMDGYGKPLQTLTQMQYGYEVEEEPKYYIQLPSITWGTYLVKDYDNELVVWQNTKQGTPFTEQEIKAIDERYWPFAVPVEQAVAE